MDRLRIKNYFSRLLWWQKIGLIFPQLFFLITLPRTYWKIYKNLFKFKNSESKLITGFSKQTALIFTWYLKNAECVKKYGSRGYAYEDGLGFSLKERFWLNSLSLKLYNKLKVKNFIFVAVSLLFLAIISIGYFQSISWLFIGLLILLAIGSPLFLVSFFRFAKPEILSWGFFPLIIYAFFTQSYLIAIIFLTIVALLNFTTCILALETILLFALFSNNFVNGILVVIIPSIILALTLVPFLKSSFVTGVFENLGGRKMKSRQESLLKIRAEDLYLEFFYLLFVVSLISQKVSLDYIILLINPLVLFIINQTLFRYSDNHTFFRFLFVIATMFTILHPSLLVFVLYLVFIYLSPAAILDVRKNIFSDFPYLKTCSLIKTNKFFEHFFSSIPAQSRIIFETQDTEKNMGGFRAIIVYFEYLLFKKGVELLPTEFLRLTQLQYFMQEYVKINNCSDKKIIEDKCKEIGANYILVYSKNFAENLKKWGYKKIKKLKWQELQEHLWDIETIPKKNLYLFKMPFSTYLIEPTTCLKREPNRMTFNAEPEIEYIIKYTYHSDWQAFQGKEKIPIYQTQGKLSYLALCPKYKGKVRLEFKTNRWK